MKIAIVCYPTFGGSGVIATELAIELSKRGHEVHLICYHRPVRLDREYPNLTFHKVETTSYSLFPYPFYSLSFASKIYQVIEDYDLEIVHVHYAIPHSISALLAKFICKKKVKIITTLHGTDIHLIGLDPSYYHITKFGIEESDGITAVSEYLKGVTVEEFKLQRPIAVIPNFVDADKFNRDLYPSGYRRLYALDEEKIITHISNFREIKNIPALIEVFQTVSSQIPAKLLLIGDGPQWNYVEGLVRRSGLLKYVNLLGEENSVEPILAITDLFLSTSRMESFGLAILEAMSSQVPVVATKVGGIPEVVVEGKSGFLVEDTEEMPALAIKILQDSDLQRRLGEAGRKIAREKFSLKEVVSQYEDYYRGIP